jgi:hypothetical protein
MMNNKQLLFSLGILTLLASILACNVPAVTSTPILSSPDIEGISPGVVTDTSTPELAPSVLPPPAVDLLRVVYIKGDNVWLWTEEIGTRQLTVSGGARKPRLSGDSLVVAFLRSGELWAVNADGTNERQLVSAVFLSSLATGGDTAEVNDLVWKPGSHTIYFNSLMVVTEAGYRIPQADLFSSDADAGVDAVTSLESMGSGGVPYFSPDGRIVALVQPDKIIFLEVTGAFWNVALTFQNILTYSEWSYIPEVVWQADSSAVKVVIPAHDPLNDPSEVTTIWNVPVSGSASILDTFIAVPGYASKPLLSPDGNQVLYMAGSGSDNTIQVRQIGGLDTGYTFAAAGQIGILNWSPDSIHFVYWLPDLSTTYVAEVGVAANYVSDISPDARLIRWIDSNRVIYISNSGEIRFRPVDGVSNLVDSNVSDYDFGFVVR